MSLKCKLLFVIGLLLLCVSCSGQRDIRIAVYIPGTLDGDARFANMQNNNPFAPAKQFSGGPSYEAFADGLRRFALEKPQVDLRIFEGGFDPSMWEMQLTDIFEQNKIDYFITTGAAMQTLVTKLAKEHTHLKILYFESELAPSKNIYTIKNTVHLSPDTKASAISDFSYEQLKKIIKIK